jgi:hypothetical protein
MVFFEYLYYRLYSWNLRKHGERDTPQWNALFAVSFMMFENLCLIGLIIQFFGIRVFSSHSVPKLQVAFVMFSIYIINYWIFVRNKNYKKIHKKYSNESSNIKKRKAIWLWVYFIGSFVFGIALSLIDKESISK